MGWDLLVGEGSIGLGILGLLLGAEFLDGGGYFVLAGELPVLGWVVGRKVGNLRAELLQQGAGFGQFVAMNVGLAIRPRPLVGREGVLLRLLAVADGEPQVREGAVGWPPCVCELLSFAAWIVKLAEVELGEGELGFRRRIGLSDSARHCHGLVEALNS